MSAHDLDAVVVGSGPNGLAAAVQIARAGRSVRVFEGRETIGGGSRTEELTLPGFWHDVCSAIHPLGAGSPFFQSLPLHRYGLEWIEPPVQLAHPFDDGSAAALYRSVAATAEHMGEDGPGYERLIGGVVKSWERMLPDILRPIIHVPRAPIPLAGFGLRALLPATTLARLTLRTDRARAMFAGMAAHGMVRLDRPLTASFGLVLAAAAHAAGWPVAKGGSQAIANALAAYLRDLGGEIETGHPVASLDDLPRARATLLDVMPGQLAALAGSRLASDERKKLRAYEHGPGVFKLDYALSGPVPWRAPECREAGTIHLGGSMAEIAQGEREVIEGRHPERPFVLVAQQSLIDPGRAPPGQHTFWAYCHVPNGSDVDMTEPIERQVERFAPGFRDLVLARAKRGSAALEADNPNYVGGDIGGGSSQGLRVLFRSGVTPWPYRTAIPGVYLCSSATPPGGGVHGMCGFHAANAALGRELR